MSIPRDEIYEITIVKSGRHTGFICKTYVRDVSVTRIKMLEKKMKRIHS